MFCPTETTQLPGPGVNTRALWTDPMFCPTETTQLPGPVQKSVLRGLVTGAAETALSALLPLAGGGQERHHGPPFPHR